MTIRVWVNTAWFDLFRKAVGHGWYSILDYATTDRGTSETLLLLHAPSTRRTRKVLREYLARVGGQS